MYREARKLERKGYSGAAQQVAAAAAQQKLTNERPGFLSADTAIEEQKLRMQAEMQRAAVASGMRPQETRRGLYEDIRAAAGQGLTGAAGTKQLAGFRARATQLGVTPEAFDRTVGGKLGVALPATTPAATTTPAVTPTPTAPAGATTTPPVVVPAVTAPAMPRVGKIGDKPASDVLRSMRQPSFDEQFASFTGAVSDTAPQGTASDEAGFLKGVTRLTTELGGDLTRKQAVEEMNRLRMAAGQTPADVNATLNALLKQDREARKRKAEEITASR